MGCTDFELDLNMSPSHAYVFGVSIGFCNGVEYLVDGYGIKVQDEHNNGTPLFEYVKKIAEFAGVPKPVLEGQTRENFIVGFTEGVVARSNISGRRKPVNG